MDEFSCSKTVYHVQIIKQFSNLEYSESLRSTQVNIPSQGIFVNSALFTRNGPVCTRPRTVSVSKPAFGKMATQTSPTTTPPRWPSLVQRLQVMLWHSRRWEPLDCRLHALEPLTTPAGDFSCCGLRARGGDPLFAQDAFWPRVSGGCQLDRTGQFAVNSTVNLTTSEDWINSPRVNDGLNVCIPIAHTPQNSLIFHAAHRSARRGTRLHVRTSGQRHRFECWSTCCQNPSHQGSPKQSNKPPQE